MHMFKLTCKKIIAILRSKILQNSVALTDLYADDTTIYDIPNDKQVFENNLLRSLVLLQPWCKEN